MKQKAVTLLETLISLCVIIILLGAGVFSFSTFLGRTGLHAAARSVVSVLRSARDYAISNNKNYYVFFVTATTPDTSDTYCIQTSVTGYDPATASYDSSRAIDKVYKLPTGITFVNINFTKGSTNNAACFQPTGALDETDPEKSVDVRDSKNNSKTIKVEKTTGRAKIE